MDNALIQQTMLGLPLSFKKALQHLFSLSDVQSREQTTLSQIR